ncbi:hypothetical protein GQ53DRAFT_740129 [Thozetella sp. PMI_491]|nr:hypothetical protein GQ53DRAFT_740129 [Thozetella sp. PMI_491]
MSGIVNKVKEAIHGDSHKHENNVPEGTYGPHSSRTANAADPRVDSDRDNTARHAGTARTAGHGEFGSGHGFVGTEGSAAPGPNMAASGYETRVGTGAAGTGRADATPGTYDSGVHAPGHRVAGSGVTGVTGTHGAPTGTFGPHSSKMANAADPRVDSDRDGRAAIGTGPGPAPNTAGPHKNDALNKMDPRVDSDMDGSRTVGGNKTYQ